MSHHLGLPDHVSGWPCPLCGTAAAPTIEVGVFRYARCRECALISLDPEQLPRPLEEVVRYAHHRNSAEDGGYRTFLRRLADPVRARLNAGASGLDFGCGPSPVLADMLTEAGHPTAAYDPVFEPQANLLLRRYDFIVCSEVVEHFHRPAEAFAQLGGLLIDGGLLGIMTRLHREDIDFATWWYRRDPTHVCFYSEVTMRWIAARHGWGIELPDDDVVLFSMPVRPRDSA